MLRIIQRLLLPLLMLSLAACGGGDDDGRVNNPTEFSTIKFIPVSPHAPLYSILIDDDLSDDEEGLQVSVRPSHGQAVSLTRVETDGRMTVRYTLPKGSGVENNFKNAFPPFGLAIQLQQRYEMFLAGEYPDGEYWMINMPRLFEERETQARLALTHAAPSPEAIDVYLVKDDASISSANLIASLGARETDHSVRVDPGEYRLKIAAAGGADVVYTSPEFTVAAGNDLSFVAIDNAWAQPESLDHPPIVVSRSSNSSSSLLFSEDSGAFVRVAHSSNDSGPLDVILNDETTPIPLAEGLALGEVSPYDQLDGGVYNTKIYPAAGSEVALEANYNLINGVHWTMVMVRPWEELRALLLSENARSIDGQARLRVIHASEKAKELNLFVTAPGADVTELDDEGAPAIPIRYPGMSRYRMTPYISIAPGEFDLTFTQQLDVDGIAPQIVYGPLPLTLADGGVYTLLLRDEAGGASVAHTWISSSPETPEE